MLDEAAKRTGLKRKVLIRKLTGWRPAVVGKRKRRRKRKASYGAEVITALAVVWEIFDYPCGQRLEGALRQQIEHLRELGELRCSAAVAEKLQRVSAKTIDRLLAKEKQARLLKRNRNPGVHPLLYQKIAVKRAGDYDPGEVGNLQLDYVAHCGRWAGGEYVHTLSGVDVASQWWEGQAIAGRSQQATREGLEGMRQRFPFRIREIHPDNDSGMINDLIWRYCRQAGIRMTRSRPYQKNDNAWVEQKNWTHVRKLVGYQRYDTPREMSLLNELYELFGRYRNFCLPVMKLVEKVRVGGQIHRRYDQARTPYQRLLESGQINRKTKARREAIYQSLNPAQLHRPIEELRTRLFEVAEAKGGAGPRRAGRRGLGIWLGSRRRAVA